VTDIDTGALKENFAYVAAHGDDVGMWFYSHLFLHYPETRDMFPPSMARQRGRLLDALGRIVSNVDRVGDLVPYLQDLGRDHRKFGTLAPHYPAVGDSLVATLRHYSGGAWTDRLEADWTAAYGIVANAMVAAADEAAKTEPPYWEAEVVDVQRRTFDITVLRIRTQEPVPYLAGQSLAVEATELLPREWRWYTPANPPGTTEIELHARLLSGGPVSTMLVRRAAPGDRLRLGPPIGRLTIDGDSSRPLLMIAGSTGLAPMKALIGQLAAAGEGRRTHLFFGARTVREVYDAEALDALAAKHDWLTVVTAVSDDSRWHGEQGLVGEVAVGAADWTEHDAYVCGSPQMVEATVKLLVANGVPEERIRFDEFGES
jgi:NAD(P)H-flavin reductase/hemoglobin-like flavoprotein